MQHRLSVTYRHNFNGYPHIFDHGRPEYEDVDVVRRRGLRIRVPTRPGMSWKITRVLECPGNALEFKSVLECPGIKLNCPGKLPWKTLHSICGCFTVLILVVKMH